jgi:hypothetical protein
MYFHASVRDAKRAELEEGLAEVLAGPFEEQMSLLTEREMVSALLWADAALHAQNHCFWRRSGPGKVPVRICITRAACIPICALPTR